MPKVQQTTTITVDNTAFAVDKMSPNLQQMIVFMDEWRQKDVDLTVEISMVKAALRDIQNSIYVAIKKEREDALEKAKALGLIPADAAPAAAVEAPAKA